MTCSHAYWKLADTDAVQPPPFNSVANVLDDRNMSYARTPRRWLHATAGHQRAMACHLEFVVTVTVKEVR
jgi:hypothetical protein